MNKLLSTMLACVFASASSLAIAAPEVPPPPAHQQKNQVPDSTDHGNYLKAQPDNNAGSAGDNQRSGDPKAHPAAKEKSKRFNEKPEDGGTGTGATGNTR